MKSKKKISESGASVFELLVVLIIAAILLTFAVAQFGTSRTQFQRQNIAREFKVNLERCRFDSVRRRAAADIEMARVIIRSATSYDVMTDTNQDGKIESFEARTVDFTGRSDVKIIAPSTTFPVTIRFNQRGHITTDGMGGSVTPLFTVCSGVCEINTTLTAANSNVISISPTGTIAMLFGGDVIPPLADPTISTVSAVSDVNLWLTLMPGAPPPSSTTLPPPSTTPSPAPSGSPSTSPTPFSCPKGGLKSSGCTCDGGRKFKGTTGCQ